MNKIEQLIKQLCPEGVPFVKLGEVGEFVRGNGLQKKDFTESGVGCIHYGQIYTYYGLTTTTTKSFVDKDTASKLKEVNKGDIIFAVTSENVEDLCKCVVWLGNETIVTGGHAVIYKHNQNAKYLAHYFKTEEFAKQKRKFAKGVKVMDIKAADMENILIPLPPLCIQEEIVKVLDKFSELEAELEAELALRKKQYEFYRNHLLAFDNVGGGKYLVKHLKIKDICENVCSGGTPSRNKPEYYMGNIPWLRTQEVDWNEIHETELSITQEAVDNSSAKIIPANCVIIAMYGATAAKACINKIPLTTNQACCNLKIAEDIAMPKYVYHWIANNYLKIKNLGEGSQNNLNAQKIKDLTIPIPPLSEQERIAGILDRFEALTTSISEGLPAELNMRRLQYEHYRNKLLSFERA